MRTSVSVLTFLLESVFEVSFFLLMEIEDIGLAPEVPDDPAPGSDPEVPNKLSVRRQEDNIVSHRLGEGFT